MKLKEPEKIAFDIDDGINLDFDASKGEREQAFWKTVQSGFSAVSVKDGKVFRETDHCPDCVRAVRGKIKERILDFVNRYSRTLAQGGEFDCPGGVVETWSWETVKFIIAFNTSFTYTPDEFMDEDDDCDHTEMDYLDDETAFRFDVVKACDQLVLEGAALAKRIGSDSYALWTDAMIKLANRKEEIQHTAVDVIVTALERIWADERSWIFMKGRHGKKRPLKKAKKSKR